MLRFGEHTGRESAGIAVVIPARDEAGRIGAALHAVSESISRHGSTHVLVVANNCSDDTVDVVCSLVRAHGLPVSVLEVSLTCDEGVGTARAMGCSEAIRTMPNLRYLLSTDADCIVDPDWVSRSVAHLQQVDCVCGLIEPLAMEARCLPAAIHEPGALEHRYLQLMLETEWVLDPDPCNTWPYHGRASGASQGFRKDAYVRSGGYEALRTNEDRDIVARCRANDLTVRFADDVVVQASCRLIGRAPDGMADALSRRISDANSLADSMLEPADTHLLRVRARSLTRHRFAASGSLAGVHEMLGLDRPAIACIEAMAIGSPGRYWASLEKVSPRLVRERLRPAQLPEHIGVLETALASMTSAGMQRQVSGNAMRGSVAA